MITTASGLQYLDTTHGDGPQAAAGQHPFPPILRNATVLAAACHHPLGGG